MKEKLGFSVEVPVPNLLIEILKKEFRSKSIYNKALKVIETIIYKHQKCFEPMLEFLAYPSKEKRSITGGNEFYYIWTSLVNLGILEEKPLDDVYFSTARGICKHLRISHKWLSGDVIFVPHRIILSENLAHLDPVCAQVKQNLLRLNVDMHDERIQHEILEIASDHFREKFKITKKGIKYSHNKTFNYFNMEESFKAKYIDFERIRIESSYSHALFTLNNKNIYVSKNNLNGRIDHNLTNMPSSLIKFIKIEEEKLEEIDLKNSQPLLLSYLINEILSNREPILEDKFLKETIKNNLSPLLFSSFSTFKESDSYFEESDVAIFVNQAQKGTLYEYFASRLSNDTMSVHRNIAKKGFITAIYSKNKTNNIPKRDFIKIFPSLAKLIVSFKNEMTEYFSEHFSTGAYPELEKYKYSKTKGLKGAKAAGNDYLAVILQELESAIFIGRLLPALYDANLVVLPKHDSILCKASDYQKVIEMVTCQLDMILGTEGYRIKTKQAGEVSCIQSIDSHIQVEAA